MAENLVINGTTYPGVTTLAMQTENGETVGFYPDAVRYVEQALTDEQKAQVRENIGVTGDGERGLSIYRSSVKSGYLSSLLIDVSSLEIPSSYTPKNHDVVLTADNCLYYVDYLDAAAGKVTLASYGEIVSLTGDPGRSAYEYAKDGGYEGTEEEFAKMMAGGGGSGAQTPDWNQNDEAGAGYIKGRTHWVDDNGYHPLDGHYLTESVPWTEDMSTVVLETVELTFDSNCESTLDADSEIYEGGSYAVIWNGAEFECTGQLYEQDGVYMGIRLDTGGPCVVWAVTTEMVETVGAKMVITCSSDYCNQPNSLSIEKRGTFHHKLALELLPDEIPVGLLMGDAGLAGKLLYVDDNGCISPLTLGAGLKIEGGVLMLTTVSTTATLGTAKLGTMIL